MSPSDRYLKIVEWSDEDGCYVGTCPGIMHGGVHGIDQAKVYKQLCRVVDEWVTQLMLDGKKLPAATAGKSYSGRFVVRIDPDLHKALAIRALKDGESLNSLCTRALGEIVSK